MISLLQFVNSRRTTGTRDQYRQSLCLFFECLSGVTYEGRDGGHERVCPCCAAVRVIEPGLIDPGDPDPAADPCCRGIEPAGGSLCSDDCFKIFIALVIGQDWVFSGSAHRGFVCHFLTSKLGFSPS